MPDKLEWTAELEVLRSAVRASSRPVPEIAQAAEITPAYLYQVLSGSKIPSAAVRQRIVDALSPSNTDSPNNESDLTLLFGLLSTPERSFHLWRVAQDLLLGEYRQCGDDQERHRLLETIWVPMRMAWWLRGSAKRVALYRQEISPSSSVERFGDWLSRRVDVEDRLACTLGLLCWREPELLFALFRAGQPANFDLEPHRELIPRELWEAANPAQPQP